MNLDRKAIAPLLIKFFPSMDKASSEEWHFFLDKVTGIETPLDMPNAQAFDRWREKLATLGYPVFPYQAVDVAAMKAKAAKALEAENARAAKLGTTLEQLAREAPKIPAIELLKAKK